MKRSIVILCLFLVLCGCTLDVAEEDRARLDRLNAEIAMLRIEVESLQQDKAELAADLAAIADALEKIAEYIDDTTRHS